MSVPETLDDLPRRFAGWAVSRSLAPVSVAGISVALAVCAAGWFSAGTRPGNVNGALALCVSYLVGVLPGSSPARAAVRPRGTLTPMLDGWRTGAPRRPSTPSTQGWP